MRCRVVWLLSLPVYSFDSNVGLAQVTVKGQASQWFAFDYEALLPTPVLIEVHTSPARCSTSGCDVTVSGSDLDSGCEVLVDNALGELVLQPILAASSTLQFTLPAGQGRVSIRVRIVGTTVVSNSISYAYATPTISSVSPTTGVTGGGVLVTIVGTNLGVDTSNATFVPSACQTHNAVMIGRFPCTPVTWTSTYITCTTSAGFGSGLPVTVQQSTLFAPPTGAAPFTFYTSDCTTYAAAPATFSYSAPVVSSLTPSSGGTAGGTTVTIRGAGFGSLASPTVLLQVPLPGGRRSANLTATVKSFTDSTVVVTMPLGAGAQLTLYVAHGSSGATVAVPNAWSYTAPVVTGFVPRGLALLSAPDPHMPCNGYNLTTLQYGSWSPSDCTNIWLPATGVTLDIYGSNFGGAAVFSAIGGASVLLGGEPCYALPGSPLFVSNTQLTCAVSNMAAGQLNPKNTSVTIAGQSATLPHRLSLYALCGPGYVGSTGTWVRWWQLYVR